MPDRQDAHGLEARLLSIRCSRIDDPMQSYHAWPSTILGSLGWRIRAASPPRTPPIIARCDSPFSNKSPNERSGVISDVKGFLELYRYPVIRQPRVSDFRITDLLIQKKNERPVSLSHRLSPRAQNTSRRGFMLMLLYPSCLTDHLEFRNGRAWTCSAVVLGCA